MATQESANTVDAKSDGTANTPARAQWRRILLVAILALGILAWLTPAILARTSLRQNIVEILFPEYSGESSIGSASLGWNSPVALRDISLRDAEGRQWLFIPEAASSKTLISLLFSESPDLGTFTLVKPTLSVRLREDGSDFEDYLAEVLGGDESGEPSSLTLEIQHGTANWIDAAGNQTAGGIEKLDATIHQAADAPLPAPVSISGVLTDGEHPGPFQIRIDEPTSAGTLDASLTTENVPLASLVPWLERFGINLAATGVLSSDLIISASLKSAYPIAVAGRIDGKRLRVTLPNSLASEPLLFEQAALHGKLVHHGRRIAFEKVAAETAAARLSLDGALDLDVLAAGSDWKQRIHQILGQDVHLSGSVDLARLASVVSLSLPAGKTLESGRVQFSVKTEGDDAVRRGVASLTTSDVVASLPDRQIAWKSPLSMNIVLKQDAGGLSAEKLQARSDFLTLDGSIAGGAGHIKFDINLNELRNQLSQFVPISAQALAGRASGQCRVEQGGNPGVFKITGDAQLTDFAFTWAGGRWSEEDFRGEGTAQVRLVGRQLEEIQSATATLQSAEGDAATLTLVNEATRPASETWPFDVTIKGELSRWITRLQSWSVLPRQLAWSARGALDASAHVIHDASGTKVKNLKGTITPFQASHASIAIDEPKLAFQGDTAHAAATNTLTSHNLRVACDSIGVQTTSLAVPLSTSDPLKFQGTIRGSLSELARYGIPRGLGVWPSGVIAGEVDLTHGNDTSGFNAHLEIQKPAVNRRVTTAPGNSAWQPLWSDNTATLALAGQYASAKDEFVIETARWQSQGAAIDLAGQIQQAGTRANATLNGRVTYDLAALRAHVPALALEDIVVAGQGTREFSIRGPLVATTSFLDPALQADAGIGWQKLNLWGLPFGDGEINAAVQNNRLTLASSRVPLAGGSVQASGTMAIAAPFSMAISQGRIVEKAQLTPEMCRAWLSYAAPLLADVTEVRGTMSLDLTQAAVPLLNPAGTRANGVLSVESVTAEPGPLARSLLKTVQQIQRIAGRDATQGSDLQLTAPAQQVRLTIAGGRVHHDRFRVQLGDSDGPIIQTSGSVGFDDSLNLVAEIPLDRRWFRDERLAGILGGQTLRIPIGGTLSQPAPDPRALQEFSRRAAAGAVKNLLDGQLEKQFGDDPDNPLKKLLGR